MRKYSLFGLLVLSVVIYSTAITAQTRSLRIQFLSGESTEIALIRLSKIKFDSEDVLLEFREGTTLRYGIATISQMNYRDYTSVSSVQVGSQAILLSSASDAQQLWLENLPEGGSQISIYSVTGAHILRENAVGPVHTMDISSLSKGVYVLKIKEQVIKFTKQ